MRIVGRLAADVAGLFPQYVAQRLDDEAATHVLRRLGGFSPERPFEPWCRTVLQNFAVDLFRAGRRSPVSVDRVADLADTPSALDEVLRHEESSFNRQRLRDAHALLGGLRRSLSGRPGIDYFAVLQLHARLALAARVTSCLDRRCPLRSRGLADLIEDWWPWGENVTSLRCGPDWPTLGELWGPLRPLMNRPPFRVTARRLCELAGTEGRKVSASTWVKWCQRARDRARCLVSRDDWNGCIAPWLESAPDSRPG